MKIKELCKQAIQAFDSMPYKHIVAGFIVTTVAVAFCAHMYFKQPDMSALAGDLVMTEQDRQAMFHNLEARLTATEGRLNDAHSKLQCAEGRINDLETKTVGGKKSLASMRLAQATKSAKQKAALVDEHIRNEVRRQLASMDDEDKGL